MKEPMTKFHHIALSVSNMEESVQWYKKYFDLDVVSRMTIPHNGVAIAFIGNEDFIIELLEVPGANPLPPERSHPDTDNQTLGCKHFCVAVENNVEFVNKLRADGVTIAFEPAGMPRYCAFVLDPTGNIIEVFDKDFDISSVNK